MVSVLAVGLTLLTSAHQKDVTLPPGLYSYPGLAAELTNQGFAVTCDPRIHLRCALIRIPPRPWSSLEPLLDHALGITFAATDAGPLEMRPDATTATSEEILLHRFARNYSDAAQAAVRNGWEYMQRAIGLRASGLEPPAEIQSAISSMPRGSPDWYALTVARGLMDSYASRRDYADLWEGVNVLSVLKGMPPVLYTADELMALAPPDNPIGAVAPPPIKTFGIFSLDGERVIAPLWVESRRFNNRNLALSKEAFAIVNITAPGLVWDKPGYYDGPNSFGYIPEWRDLYKGLSTYGALQARLRATAEWAASSVVRDPLGQVVGAPSLWDLASAWSVKEGRPLLMEVFLNRQQPMDGGTGASLESALLGEDRAEPATGIAANPWTVEQFDGVTVIHDELAFIDRVAPLEPAAEIQSFNRRTASAGQSSVSDLVEACRLLKPEAALANLDGGQDGPFADFSFAAAYLRLVSSSPFQKKLEAVRPGQSLRIPFKDCAATARREFEAEVRSLALRRPMDWSTALWPDFDEVLAGCTVIAKAITVEGSDSLSFQISSPILKSPTGLCPVSIGPIGFPY